jgi:hypothetical protein
MPPPKKPVSNSEEIKDHGGSRTHDHRFANIVLCPLRYRATFPFIVEVQTLPLLTRETLTGLWGDGASLRPRLFTTCRPNPCSSSEGQWRFRSQPGKLLSSGFRCHRRHPGHLGTSSKNHPGRSVPCYLSIGGTTCPPRRHPLLPCSYPSHPRA